MPRFRYEATDRAGVPVHGTADAADETALSAVLTERGLKLVSSSELSLDALISAHHQTLPRLYQLRVGEQLREALLSGLPAHEAVRAVAAEPLSHPMLGIAPWLQGISVMVFGASLTVWLLSGNALMPTIASGILALVVIPLLWLLLWWIYRQRPKQLLRTFASQIERGESLPAELSLAVPSEMRSVMKSNISDTAKARVAADLVPCLLGGNLKTQQFVMATVGPLALLFAMMIVLYSGLLFVIPQFTSIFMGFGVELPWLTQMIVWVSQMIDGLGITGWVVFILLGCAFLIVTAMALSTGLVNEALCQIPLFGMAFRWAMQARVARILSAMLRNDCTYAESLRTATAGSGFQAVAKVGEAMSEELESGTGTVRRTAMLSGLPISMMFVNDTGRSDDERRSGIARTFYNLSEMLESATLSQGRLFAVVVQFFTLMIGSLAVGVTVIAMFLPLIRLLRDLS